MRISAPSRPAVEALAQIAGLAATCWVVWETVLSGRRDLLFKIATGVEVSVGAWIWAAVVVLLLRLIVRNFSNLDVAPATLRASTVGVWFAPATLLLQDGSVWGVTSAVVLIAGAARLLAVPKEEPALPAPAEVAILGAGKLPIDLLAHHFGAALLAAAGLQAALALRLMRHRAPAAALLVLSLATIATLASGLGVWGKQKTPNLPRFVMALCLTVLLALMGGRYLSGWGSGSGSGSGSGNSAQGGADRPSGSARTPQAGANPPPATWNLPGAFPGVILWPEVRPVTTLISPVLAGRGPSAAPARPLSIPFGGEYWMYRPPYRQPPSNSFFQRGTPTKLSFSTPDMAPLNVEARQKLATPIRLGCCRAIDVEIRNEERRELEIWLELMLCNTDNGKRRSLSLGMQKVRSSPGERNGETVPAVETLTFSIPASAPFREFDEFQVEFRRLWGRSHSPRVAIERFVLQP